MAPFFSIIISAYNRGDMLRSALESIRGQTFEDFECLAMDDGSTDNVPQVIASFAGDRRFRALRNDKNKGMNAARNIAFEAATGDYVTFLDSDDMWLPSRLEAFHARIKSSPESGFLFSNAYLLRFGRLIGLLFDPRRPIPEGVVPGHFAVGDGQLPYLTTNVAIRRDAFTRWGGFSKGFKATDTELFARYLSHGLPVAVIREPLAVRRIHEDQITAGHAENFRQSMAALPATGASEDEARRLRADTAREVALHMIKAARPREARELLLEVLGPAARGSMLWRLAGLPAVFFRALSGVRREYLKLRGHPRLLSPRYRAVWRTISPLLAEEKTAQDKP